MRAEELVHWLRLALPMWVLVTLPALARADDHASLATLCGYPGYPPQFPASSVGDTFYEGRLARTVLCQYDGTVLPSGTNMGVVFEDLPPVSSDYAQAN